MACGKAMTLDEWFKEWTLTYKSRRVKPGTLRNYRSVYGAYLREILGEKELRRIRPKELQKILNDLADSGYSESTIALVMAVMSGMFKTAQRLEIIKTNPVKLLECPRGKETVHHKALTAVEQAHFITYAGCSELGSFFILAICTGMRYGELAGLMWGDVDLEKRIIHVRHNAVRVNGVYSVGTPKTRSSVRDIPLVDRAYYVLCERRSKTPLTTDATFVFGNGTDPVDYEHVKRELAVIKRRMHCDGISFPQDFTLHGARDSFATRCVEQGMSLYILRDILGHSTIRQTEIYAQNLPDTLTEAIRAVSDAF